MRLCSFFSAMYSEIFDAVPQNQNVNTIMGEVRQYSAPVGRGLGVGDKGTQ